MRNMFRNNTSAVGFILLHNRAFTNLSDFSPPLISNSQVVLPLFSRRGLPIPAIDRERGLELDYGENYPRGDSSTI
jgi:hypothetical protein